ncbi:hypothetical protein [Bradyrhizobium sp. SZCCHNR3118]|uniref:hypothetical protein n=1 Tax=Bradyrhizobium sp. SZCCHNR3118 TaxID=3057468 RepID=UPI002916BA6D|nr:hypothetical protein [Bradyrhizobium sp. SZCCHNR3118]
MRALHAMERRLQDLERKFQGKERLGKIVDVKFEKQRWYVKFNDGQDQNPSGTASSRGDTVKSDWMPWQSFSHGTIKSSIPPKKGQHALMRGVDGMMELATVEPYHYGPDNPSPHGKPDEIVHLVEDEGHQTSEQGQQGDGSGGDNGSQGGSNNKYNTWQRVTKNLHHLIIQKKGANMDAMGDLGGLAGMAGLNGLDMSNFTSAIGGLGNLSSIAGLNLGNLADFSQISSMINISNLSKFADLGQIAQAAGMGQLTQVGNIVNTVQSVLGGASFQAPGGDPGADGQGAAQKQQASRKIPEVGDNGHSDTTSVLADHEKILKTVGENKSLYRQDEDKVNIRYGEEGKKADVLIDGDQVKIQFKDKAAVVKWSDNDLNLSFGDKQANIKLDKDQVVLTQGDKTSVTIQNDHVEVKGATACSCGVDGRWVYVTPDRVNLGVSGPTEQADVRVMTEAGPSQKVWAKLA